MYATSPSKSLIKLLYTYVPLTIAKDIGIYRWNDAYKKRPKNFVCHTMVHWSGYSLFVGQEAAFLAQQIR